MNRLELLLVLALVLSLVIWLVKSPWFDRQLNKLFEQPNKDANKISEEAATLEVKREALKKDLEDRKQKLEQEQKQVSEIKL